jgi:hypothetical protein
MKPKIAVDPKSAPGEAMMGNYRVQVSDGPQAGVKCFPTLKAAEAHRDWLRLNNVADLKIRIVCTRL